MANSNITKRNLGPHYGNIRNRLTFAQAYQHITNNPNTQYRTTGNNTPFTAHATRATRAKHENQQVIVFRSQGQERARAYDCCWGHQTNHNGTHIDCYTEAI